MGLRTKYHQPQRGCIHQPATATKTDFCLMYPPKKRFVNFGDESETQSLATI